MSGISKLSMRLFGLPYQFPKTVDPRVNTISSTIGKKYNENILLDAPICTIIPGEPSYLPGARKNKKISTAAALIEGHNGNMSALTQLLGDLNDEDLRLYDFKNNYNDYIKYVNVLCRAGAVFLELEDTITIGSTTSTFQNFDWRNYRWNSMANASTSKKLQLLKKSISKKVNGGSYSLKGTELNMYTADGTEGTLKQVLTNYNYVQFYVDPDVSSGEDLSNTTGESMLKGLFDSGASTMKDIAFMANSGGIDTQTLQTFTQESSAALQAGVSEILGNNTISGALSRIINLGGNVLQGHNIVIPDIYQTSTFSKNFSITVHLKSPYGTRLGYYMDIFVPLMHLLALTMPKQESANSFSSPFLIKAYVDGIFTCNLGLVTGINITRVNESRSVYGLPSEVDVTLNITDLYSDLSMSPSSTPMQFANNSSLIEYIATNCGMTLTAPNFNKKWKNIVNSVVTSLTDVPKTVKGTVDEKIFSTIANLTSLYK